MPHERSTSEAVLRPGSPSLLVNNRVFHRIPVEGVSVEMHQPDGSIAGAQVRYSSRQR